MLKKGFTIVELLVIVVVIGILAAVSVYGYSSYTSYSRNTQRQADIESISTALEKYYEDKGQYPSVATMTTTNSGHLAELLKLDKAAFTTPTASTTTTTSLVNYDTNTTTTNDVYRYRGYGTDTNECKNNTNLEPLTIKPIKLASLEPFLAAGTVAGYCEAYSLSWRKEGDSSWQYVYSRHGTSFH